MGWVSHLFGFRRRSGASRDALGIFFIFLGCSRAGWVGAHACRARVTLSTLYKTLGFGGSSRVQNARIRASKVVCFGLGMAYSGGKGSFRFVSCVVETMKGWWLLPALVPTAVSTRTHTFLCAFFPFGQLGWYVPPCSLYKYVFLCSRTTLEHRTSAAAHLSFVVRVNRARSFSFEARGGGAVIFLIL